VYCRKRPVDPRWRPFCGERCKMADLGHWLSGSYRVPVRQDEDRDTDTPDGSGEPKTTTDDAS
jgi:endogenous inhibitor of DNA gyrase (YacG/DUF329 family)